MNKLLPKTVNNPKGFTLVELLVVIVILAILGVIGVTLFSGTQQGARDAKRKEDVQAMSDAMEVNYKPGSGYTTPMSTAWFADGTTPSNPAPGGTPYVTTLATTGFTICANLEVSTGNATTSTGTSLGQVSNGAWFCKKNSQ